MSRPNFRVSIESCLSGAFATAIRTVDFATTGETLTLEILMIDLSLFLSLSNSPTNNLSRLRTHRDLSLSLSQTHRPTSSLSLKNTESKIDSLSLSR